MKTPKQTRNVCSFCESGKLSREHVWPEWASPILPSSSGYTQFKLSQGPNPVPKQEWASDRQGPITNIKMKVVCRDCNSGWMNQQEQRVRPYLTEMIGGKRTLLDREVHEAVAAWIAMKLMVLDRSPASGRVFLDEELRTFRQTLSPPATLQIWLLHCGDRDWRTAYRAMERSISNTAERPTFHMPNVKFALWGIGELLAITLYQRDVAVRFQLREQAAIQIWPKIGSELVWPPNRRLSAFEAEDVAQYLRNSEPQNFRWAPELQ